MKFLDATGLARVWAKVREADTALQNSIDALQESAGGASVTIGDREAATCLGGLAIDLGTFQSAGEAEAFAARADVCGTYTLILFRVETATNTKTAAILNTLYNSAKSARQQYTLGKDLYTRNITGIQDALSASDPTATTPEAWTDAAITAATTADIDAIFE